MLKARKRKKRQKERSTCKVKRNVTAYMSQIVHQLILLRAYCAQYHLQIMFKRAEPIKTMKRGITITVSSLANSELLQSIRTPVLFWLLVWYFHVNFKLVLACNLSKQHKTNTSFYWSILK